MITDETIIKNRLEPITYKVKKILNVFEDNAFKFLCNSQRIF